MSYLVFARKWRPQTFKDVVGQEHITRTLKNAIEKGRLAHALIFSGARGVGKTSVARILAKAINCENGPGPEPCNQCGICSEITREIAVDVIEIDGASNRGIDEIRRLRETILFRPTRCRYKVYIIDEVHMLTREAFNALLKTLEEPPPHVYFFFATTEAVKIPDTIRSRCQHFEFRLLTPSEIATHLKKIADREGLSLNDEAIGLIARAAQGSIRDSLSLLDQVVAFGARTSGEVSEALGLIPGDLVRELAVSVLRGEPAQAILAIEKVHRFGGDIQHLSQDLLLFLRDLALFAEFGRDGETLYTRPIQELEEVPDGLLDPLVLSELVDMLSRGLEGIRYSTIPRVLLETLVLRMARLKELVRIDEIIERFNNIPIQRVSEAPQTAPLEPLKGDTPRDIHDTSSPVKIPVKDQDTPEAIKSKETYQYPGKPKKDVQGFTKFLREKNPPLWSIIDRVESIEFLDEGDGRAIISIHCGSSFQKKILSESMWKGAIEDLAVTYLGRPVKVLLDEVVLDKGGQKEKGAGSESISFPAEKGNGLRDHPLVKEAMDIFGVRPEDVMVFDQKDSQP